MAPPAKKKKKAAASSAAASSKAVESLSEEEILEHLETFISDDSPLPQFDWACQLPVDNLPVIKIDNAFTLQFPCDEVVGRRLIERCSQAPYGLGAETVMDEGVRKGWQLGADKVTILSKQWLTLFGDSETSSLLDSIRQNLTPDCGKISAKFYKLLVYEPGSFFKPHRDTQREKHHFGSVVVFLPSEYAGGELAIRHAGKERKFSFSYSKEEQAADVLKCYAVAFFSDCEHEVFKVESGYRVALTYNLFFEGNKVPKPPAPVADHEVELYHYLSQLFETPEWKTSKRDLGVILQHKYALTSLSAEWLKGLDKVFYDVVANLGDEFELELVPIFINVSGQAGDDESEDHPLVYFKECVREQYMMNFNVYRLEPISAANSKPKKKKSAFLDFEDFDEAGPTEDIKMKKGELLCTVEWEGMACPTGDVHFLNDFTKLSKDHFVSARAEPTGNEGTEFQLQYQLAALIIGKK